MALHISRLRDVNLPSMRHIIALRGSGLDGVHDDSTRLHNTALGLPWSPKSNIEICRDVHQRYLAQLTASKDFSSNYKWDLWNEYTEDLFANVLATVRFHKTMHKEEKERRRWRETTDSRMAGREWLIPPGHQGQMR